MRTLNILLLLLGLLCSLSAPAMTTVFSGSPPAESSTGKASQTSGRSDEEAPKQAKTDENPQSERDTDANKSSGE